MDPREDRHRRLLMDISNEMIVDSQEYVNFIFWMESYVPKGILHENKSLLEKLQAMETREHLKVDNYKALKNICEKSGNLNLIDLIQKAEKDLLEIGTIQFESDADMKEPLAKKVKYTDTERDLQSDLIEYYREKCSTIPICPCLDEVDAPLLKVYIPPYPLYSQETDKMKQMFKQPEHENKEETETPISSLHGIFNKQSDECRNIYLTADPGLGKTSFVKWLALNWCQAHSPDNDECCYFEHNEVGQMQHFEFLFLIFLRETGENERHIDSMIQNVILSVLGKSSAYTPELLERVMCNKKCLIILDGLDEWSALEIPKRSTRKNCTYLTTSRPWKFCMLSLDSTKIDQHVCIKNVEHMCFESLLLSIFSLFSERKCLRDDVSNPENACQLFREMLDEKNISHFYSTPVVLVQLIYLWNLTKEIGNSQCEIYTDIVDTLFSIAEEKVELLDRFKDKRTSSIKYFHDLSFCETYYDLMIKLGNLAFETLFSENKESSLVFDEAVALKNLPADNNTTAAAAVNILSTCVQTGLLSKQMVYVRARRKTYTYSFYHKTIQEYFAALYIQAGYGDNNHIREIIRRRCNTVSKILEIGTVFTFLSGLCPVIAVEILQSLQTIINEDEITQFYRCEAFKWWAKEQKQMKLIQDLMVSCIRESAESGHGRQDFPLQDLIIEGVHDNALYCTYLKTMIKLNSNNIKSLAVFYSIDDARLINVWKNLELPVMKNISKLQIFSKRAHGRSYALQKTNQLSPVLTITDQVLELKAQQIQSLHLNVAEGVKHSSLERFFHFVSHQTLLKTVELCVKCSEHIFTDCTGLQLNLCQQEHLQELHLHSVPVSELQLNKHLQTLMLMRVPVSELQLNKHLQKLVLSDVPVTRLYVDKQLQSLDLHDASRSQCQGLLSSLVYCDVSCLPVGVASALFRCLPEDSKLQTLKCSALESPDISALLDTVAKLSQLESIELKYMDLGEKALPLSNNMEHIRHVFIRDVTLTSSTFNHLVATAIRYKQPIKVKLYLVIVKDSITRVEQETTSQDGLPLHSGRNNSCGNSRTEFKFVTVIISSKAFRHFVEMVEKCQHPVAVKISPTESKDIIENYREGIEYVKSSPSFIKSLAEENGCHFTFQTGDQHQSDQHGVI